MEKKYRDTETEQMMVEEPAATYNVSSSCNITSQELPNRNNVMEETVSVDEYFDELISLVHKDYASL